MKSLQDSSEIPIMERHMITGEVGNHTRSPQKGRRKSHQQPRPKVMVCVTRQKHCECLVRHGVAVAQRLHHDLVVAHAVRPNENIMGSADESLALEMLYHLATEYGGEMLMLRCEDWLDGLIGYAKGNNVELMIFGASPQNAQLIYERIKKQLPGVNFIVLDAGDQVQKEIAL